MHANGLGLIAFIRTHPASEVYVTGTFDDWGKTVKLEKVGKSFEKKVDLPKTSDPVYYKVSVSDYLWLYDFQHKALIAARVYPEKCICKGQTRAKTSVESEDNFCI